MPKISVIIPIYKVEKYLTRCIDSVLAQTYTDFEVILVDDGSPDNCPAICDEYAKKDDRVNVIHKKNGGLSDARNAGLKLARGEYVMFLDGDDYVTADCFNVLLCGNEKNADLVVGTLTYAYEDSERQVFQKERENVSFKKADFPKYIYALLDERRLNYVHAKLYKRQIIEENGLSFENEQLTSAEDTVFNFTFLKYCETVSVCGESVHFYMQHAGLASRFVENRYKRFYRLSAFIESACEKMGIFDGNMKKTVGKRRVLSAIWCKDGIIKAKIDKRKKADLLNEIASDALLKNALEGFDGADDIKSLILLGGKRFLKDIGRKNRVRKIKGFLYALTPAFIKKAREKGKRQPKEF